MGSSAMLTGKNNYLLGGTVVGSIHLFYPRSPRDSKVVIFHKQEISEVIGILYPGD